MKILARDHKQLNTYLKAASQWIGEETLRLLPDGEPKEYLYDLMRGLSTTWRKTLPSCIGPALL
jgi:hypothetical protein